MTIPILKPTEPTICGGQYGQACHQAGCAFVDKCRDACAVWAGYFKKEADA